MSQTMIDITHIPFSRYGAYLAVTRDEGKDGTGDAKELVIQCARRRFEESPLFSLTFGGEAPEDFTCSAVPELLTVENENGTVRIYIRDDDTVVIDSRGLDFRLNQIHWGYGAETGERTFGSFPESAVCFRVSRSPAVIRFSTVPPTIWGATGRRICP